MDFAKISFMHSLQDRKATNDGAQRQESWRPAIFAVQSPRMQRTRALRVGDVQLYRVCDDITEPLIYLMVLFSPWAFGTTQPWSIWMMNSAGFFLGALLAAKHAIRRLKGYRPPRWDEASQRTEDRGQRTGHGNRLRDHGTTDHKTKESEGGGQRAEGRGQRAEDGGPISHLLSPIPALAVLTALILGYCLISAVNARSTYHPLELSFEYHRYVKWLPHSFDSGRSWFAFWSYLGLACSFWAVRDWLLGKSDGEQRAERQGGGQTDDRPGEYGTTGANNQQPTTNIQHPSLNLTAPLFPARLRRLLWVLAVNGGLLGLESIAQRLEGSGKLLFLVKPRVNPAGETQFGPYAYRANASQYFNLLWPVCLGFWWTLQGNAVQVLHPGLRRERNGRDARATSSRHRHHLLLVCSAIMGACPIISTSRGGALVTLGLVVMSLVSLIGAHFLFPRPGRVRVQRSGVRGSGSGVLGSDGGVPVAASAVQGSEFNVQDSGLPVSGQKLEETDHVSRTTQHAHPTSNIQGLTSNSPRGDRPSPISHLLTSMRGLGLLALCLGATLALGYLLGWKALKPRLAHLSEGFEGREQMYDTARPMAADYPLYGTGPGTFESVFQLYRVSTDTYWPAQLHNDWLETRITFGWAGSALIGLAFLTVTLRWFAPGGIRGGRRFMVLIWLALAGCLVHARFDFPFQIHSIVFLFLILCAVLSILSRKPS